LITAYAITISSNKIGSPSGYSGMGVELTVKLTHEESAAVTRLVTIAKAL
jgi:putative IMPACT (imprinted ancient) family translation regulator